MSKSKRAEFPLGRVVEVSEVDPREGRSVRGVDGAFFQYGGASEMRHAKKGGVMLRDPTVFVGPFVSLYY